MFKNKEGFILFFIIGFLSKELFYFDEEFIVVVSFFIVFFTLFQMVREVAFAELNSRSIQIYEKFEKFFLLKKNLLENLEYYYNKRNNYMLKKFLLLLNNIIYLVNKVLINKLISLNYNIKRIIVGSLGNVILLENKYLKDQLINDVRFLDKTYFYNICLEILKNINTDSIKETNFQKFF